MYSPEHAEPSRPDHKTSLAQKQIGRDQQRSAGKQKLAWRVPGQGDSCGVWRRYPGASKVSEQFAECACCDQKVSGRPVDASGA